MSIRLWSSHQCSTLLGIQNQTIMVELWIGADDVNLRCTLSQSEVIAELQATSRNHILLMGLILRIMAYIFRIPKVL